MKTALLLWALSGVPLEEWPYCKGWRDGWHAGWCNGQPACASRSPPACVIQDWGPHAYEFGFTDGFQAALKRRPKKQ